MRTTTILLLLGVAGCGVSTPAATDADQTGTHGEVEFRLRAPAVGEGENSFTLELRDAQTHAPVSGAVPKVRTMMPSMGHASDSATIIESSPGVYSITGVVFDMPGGWVIRLAVQKDAVFDETQFAFDIP
jgi:hypothetical protein